MPKNPQSFDEMLSEGQESKQSRLYRAQSNEFVDGEITDLVNLTASELANIADHPTRLSLEDLPGLQRQTVLYVRACAESSTIPTFSGLARSCGVSTEALNYWRRNHPGSPTAEWLEMVHDAFADALAASALRNLTNPVVSIFSLKARSGWRDTLTIEAPRQDPVGPASTTAELAEKYEQIFDTEEE